jgi:diadenosine tetraphosphate (Ap4A) HIT family hydrolase
MAPVASCPFCVIPPESLLKVSHSAVAFHDRYPISVQHTLVIPRRHVASIFELSEPEFADLWLLVATVRRQLIENSDTREFNIGVNDGVTAGQTVLHAHVHVIPRRKGDVVDPRGGIRWVIPEKARYW